MRVGPQDRPTARHGALDGAGDRETGGRRGLSWPLPDDMTDGALEAALYASQRSKRGHRRIEEPIAANPGGYTYSRFRELYRSFEKTLSVTMPDARRRRAAVRGFAGDGVPVLVDRLTGEIRMAQIFVAVLGASSFTFAKGTWTQAMPDWIDAHVRAFEACLAGFDNFLAGRPLTARRFGEAWCSAAVSRSI
jgi:transposase